jgi:predicted transcriptional regulator
LTRIKHKQEGNKTLVCVADILRAISDDRSLLLFTAVAVSNSESGSDILLSKLRLTRKQYYSRISELAKANLVTRRNGKYFLTSFGKIVYLYQTIIQKALHDYWKLKAIDELEISDGEMPNEEYNKIIDLLIDDEKMKEGLIHKSHPIPTE